MININQLQYFVISAEQGSLSKAAEVLYTTKPHVSKTIKSLEGYLGMELFERTPRGVILSKDGERIYAYAKNILKNAELIDHSKQNKGESLFSIATNPSSKMSELFSQFYNDKKDENIKFKYIEGGVEDIITNSDHHNHEQEAQYGYGYTLNIKYVLLHSQLVCLLEERRQITRLAHCKDTFGRTGNPCQYTCQHPECQSNGDDG